MDDDIEYMDDDIEYYEGVCPNCGEWNVVQRPCRECEDGFSHHDCGEDCCCCLDDSPNVKCDSCNGKGFHRWCTNCAWDLIENKFLNGKDERPIRQSA
jgi:hypothetical protein